MFSFKAADLSWCNLATSHKNKPGWVRRKEIKFHPPLGSMLNALHQETGMMAEPKLNKSPGGIQRNCSHPLVSHHSCIFVWSHQAAGSSMQERDSESSQWGAGAIWDCGEGGCISTVPFPWTRPEMWCTSGCSFLFVSDSVMLGMCQRVHTWARRSDYPYWQQG